MTPVGAPRTGLADPRETAANLPAELMQQITDCLIASRTVADVYRDLSVLRRTCRASDAFLNSRHAQVLHVAGRIKRQAVASAAAYHRADRVGINTDRDRAADGFQALGPVAQSRFRQDLLLMGSHATLLHPAMAHLVDPSQLTKLAHAAEQLGDAGLRNALLGQSTPHGLPARSLRRLLDHGLQRPLDWAAIDLSAQIAALPPAEQRQFVDHWFETEQQRGFGASSPALLRASDYLSQTQLDTLCAGLLHRTDAVFTSCLPAFVQRAALPNRRPGIAPGQVRAWFQHGWHCRMDQDLPVLVGTMVKAWWAHIALLSPDETAELDDMLASLTGAERRPGETDPVFMARQFLTPYTAMFRALPVSDGFADMRADMIRATPLAKIGPDLRRDLVASVTREPNRALRSHLLPVLARQADACDAVEHRMLCDALDEEPAGRNDLAGYLALFAQLTGADDRPHSAPIGSL